MHAEARITNAYISLLRLPPGESRARLQSVLAALRDEIAFQEGRYGGDVQDEFEARVAHMDKE